jgi:hypothetical protein
MKDVGLPVLKLDEDDVFQVMRKSHPFYATSMPAFEARKTLATQMSIAFALN